MILLSFSANYTPASTHKVLFFVICAVAVLAFLLWIKISLKLGAVTQNVLFSGYAVLCVVGMLISFHSPKPCAIHTLSGLRCLASI